VVFSSRELILNRDKLLEVKNYDQTFELVKYAVSAVFNMRRAGLSLILQGMPSGLGAYHILGSNVIVLNRFVLEIIKNTGRTIEEYNSYLFTVLAHEYLHSFGVVKELQVRNMTYDLCKSLLGENHLASIMARYQPWAVFPELNLYQNYDDSTNSINSFEKSFEIVKNFDKTTQSYIH